MMGLPGVQVVNVDMCQFGLVAKDSDGTLKPAKKPTRIMTNAPEVARRVARVCPNRDPSSRHRHEHVMLVDGRARQAQKYTKAFCECVCRGIAAQRARRDEGVMHLPLMDVGSMEAVDCSTHV